VEEILASRAARIVQSAAIVPMRIAAVDGVPVQHDVDSPPEPDDDELTASDDERPRGWAVRREYRSTFRDTLTTSETLVAGQWWSTGRTRPDAADGGGPAGGATLGAGDGAAGDGAAGDGAADAAAA